MNEFDIITLEKEKCNIETVNNSFKVLSINFNEKDNKALREHFNGGENFLKLVAATSYGKESLDTCLELLPSIILLNLINNPEDCLTTVEDIHQMYYEVGAQQPFFIIAHFSDEPDLQKDPYANVMRGMGIVYNRYGDTHHIDDIIEMVEQIPQFSIPVNGAGYTYLPDHIIENLGVTVGSHIGIELESHRVVLKNINCVQGNIYKKLFQTISGVIGNYEEPAFEDICTIEAEDNILYINMGEHPAIQDTSKKLLNQISDRMTFNLTPDERAHVTKGIVPNVIGKGNKFRFTVNDCCDVSPEMEIAIVEDEGRIKLPNEVLKWLQVYNGDSVVFMQDVKGKAYIEKGYISLYTPLKQLERKIFDEKQILDLTEYDIPNIRNVVEKFYKDITLRIHSESDIEKMMGKDHLLANLLREYQIRYDKRNFTESVLNDFLDVI